MRRYRFIDLAPEDRKTARRVYIGVLALYCSTILVLVAAVRLGTPSTPEPATLAQTRQSGGLFSAVAAERPDFAECAARDLKALTALGEDGEAQDVPGDDIAAAFFSLVKARAACAAGDTAGGLAIYDSIALGPVRAANK